MGLGIPSLFFNVFYWVATFVLVKGKTHGEQGLDIYGLEEDIV